MNTFGYVLIKNEKVIGVFDNEDQINNFINGGVQNQFFEKKDIKKLKFTMNSIFCHNGENTNVIVNNKTEKQSETNQEKTQGVNKKKETKEKSKELLNDEEYQKLMQKKIDTKHEINELKQQKKKYDEAKNMYDCDIKLYAQFQKEIEKNSNFEIPDIFSLKYGLFEKLEKSNRLTFDVFYEEWEVIKPKNNYSMFGSNPYEDSFVVKNTSEDINIEMDI